MSVRSAGCRERLTAQVGGMCVYCGARPADHLDHMIPRSRPHGTDALVNLAPCCAPCGQSKGDLTIAEWIAVRVAELAAGCASDRI